MKIIKFKSRKDKINGYYLLATKGTVRGLQGELFELNDFMLKYLDDEGIKYEVVEKDTLSEAEKVRNTPSIVL